ncbi:MAG: copper oxidase, partial [Casimicrobiaceae bacterium]
SMGDKGMADMGVMEMPLPDNTLPMMTGQGPHGAIEMGGMFTTVKVRDGIARNDYKDPGWYRQPPGTRAYEWTGNLPPPPRAADGASQVKTNSQQNFNVRKGSK